jgi:hypothetical protein
MKRWLEANQFLLFFILLMCGLAWYYGYLEIFNFTPRSTHQWRQADSASLAFNYYQEGLNFFKPRMHYIMGGEGYVTGAGEAPIFYYLVALAYSIFGPYDGIFRLMSWLTFLGGLYLMAKIVWEITKDWFSPVLLAGLIMTSPVLAFYTFGFTPNAPAQGLAMIGIWFFYRYVQRKAIRFFYWSMLFYTLAGLIKISALMSFAIILGLFALDCLGTFRRLSGRRIFQNSLAVIPGFLFVFAGLWAWKLWADHYNEIHNTSYFLSTIRPYWTVDDAGQQYVWERIRTIWFAAYYHPKTFWSIASIGILILLTPTRHHPVLYISYLALIVGCTTFFLLFFQQFEGHDYYILEMVLLPILILGSACLMLYRYFPKVLTHWSFRLFLILSLVFNAHHTKVVIDFRYDPESVFMSYFNPDLFKTTELRTFLKDLGITWPDKVVVAPDTSPNNSLYHYNLLGWTELYMGGTPMHAKRVKEIAGAGGKYLLLHDKSYLEKENLQEVLTYPLGIFNNSIFVFDIRPFAVSE